MVEWNFDALSVEDALLMATGDVNGKQLFSMLDRASGGTLKSIPSTQMMNVILDFKEKFAEAINPKAKKGEASAKESSPISGSERRRRSNT